MLLLVAALAAEAGPIINYFGLKPFSGRAFRIYENERMRLIISGRGRESSAAAAASLLALTPEAEAVVNIGIAGHFSLAAGTLVSVRKIRDGRGNCYEAAPLLGLLQKDLVTREALRRDYAGDFCYDMEGHGFYTAAGNFLERGRIFCLKIIFDNACLFRSVITGRRIRDRVEKALPEVEEVFSKLVVQDEKDFNPGAKYHLGDIIDRLDFLKPTEEPLLLKKGLEFF